MASIEETCGDIKKIFLEAPYFFRKQTKAEKYYREGNNTAASAVKEGASTN